MKKKKIFKLISKTYLEEYDAEGSYFKHDSGLEVFNLKSDSFKENAFCIAFKTIPSNNTGVAHVLEHTIFCGSNKYKIKDPFLYLLKGSLNTFLNAMTFPDKTIYPAASTIEKDYFNLFNIYADSIFNPLLKKESFMQEGYNINPKDFKVSGIVFNEMKGSYSNKNSLINEIANSSLFEEGAYKYDSGGIPTNIIDLTYESFLDFYKKYYTLENCKIFLCGNIQTEKNLNFIEKYIIRPYKKEKSNVNINDIEKVKRWEKGKKLTYKIPKENDNTLGVYTINWLCAEINNIEESIGLEILSEILLDDSCSFTINILKSGIGEDIAHISGINTDLKESVFSFGLQNVVEKKEKEFKNLIFSELKNLVKNKIPKELIKGILFGYEFDLKEEKGQNFPIALMIKSFKGWLNGMHPIKTLQTSYHINEIKNKLEKGIYYFENLIEKYLIFNNHYTLISFIPSYDTEKEMEEEIEKKLMSKEIEIKQNPEEFLQFKKDYNQFKKYQNKKDSKADIAKLPLLKIEDLPKQIDKSLDLNEIKELNLHSFKFKNNNIFNVNLFFKLNFLEKEDYVYLSLFKRALQDLSTKNYSYIDINNKIQNTLGQINIYESYDEDINENILNSFNISFKSFNHKVKESFELIKEILININFHDYERLKEIILSLKNDFKSLLIPKGHLLAILRSKSKLKLNEYLKELQNGITGREFWQKIKIDRESLKEIANKLDNLKNKIILKNNLSALILGNTDDILKNLENELFNLKEILKESNYYDGLLNIETSNKTLKEIIIIQSKIAFNAICFPSYKINDENYPKANFLEHILRSGIFWEKIRVIGGAYGASASIANGIFSFVSYRDPNFIKTYQAFEKSLEELANNKMANEEIYTYLIGLIGTNIYVKTKAAEALQSYKRKMLNISDSLRQAIRNAYFTITPQDIKEISEKILKQIRQRNSIASLVNNQTYEEEKNNLEKLIGKEYNVKKIY
ncbi:insulinase family protein [Borreliella lusitaniae]|uniref:insulinase family protein n=1 Tax=Borreliella lusitaniae TaxID=100177 RepID=UPI00292EE464|nr:insulinase family protein [Borreliella lusitaniae]WNY66604.1 insulinase family protein [Borreliella lusitaniae]